MTGLYPLSHRLRDNAIAPLPPEAITLAESLRDAGWETGAAVAAFVLDASFGLDQGFSRWHDVARDPLSANTFMAELPADRMVDTALADLAQMKGPFLYWLHLFDAHFPYAAPWSKPRPATTETEIRAEKRRLYDEEIAFLDAQVGRLLDGLRARTEWSDLVIVVASDHGESLGDGVEPTHGWFLYDPTVRIPLLLRFPGAPPRRTGTQASLVDVMPTLLELLDVARPDLRFDGVSLAATVRGRDDEPPERALALEAWYSYANFGWAPFEGCVQGALKYVRARRERLFDRAQDPTERTDLFTPEEVRARGLRRRLDAMLAAPAVTLEPGGIALTEEMRQMIAATGYVEPAILDFSTRPDVAALEDPEDHVELLHELERITQATFEGDPELAAKGYRRLIAVAPRSAMAHEMLASTLLKMQRPEVMAEAEAETRIALEIDFHRPTSHSNLGLIAMRRARSAATKEECRKQCRTSIDEYRLALGVDRSSPIALANLANVLLLAADVEPPDAVAARRELVAEAIARFDRFLEVVPPDQADRANMEAARAAARGRLKELGSK